MGRIPVQVIGYDYPGEMVAQRTPTCRLYYAGHSSDTGASGKGTSNETERVALARGHVMSS